MSDCRFGVSPVNYPDPDPDPDVAQMSLANIKTDETNKSEDKNCLFRCQHKCPIKIR